MMIAKCTKLHFLQTCGGGGVSKTARARSDGCFVNCVTWLWGVGLTPSACGGIPDGGDFSPSAKMTIFDGNPPRARGVFEKAGIPLFQKYPGPEGVFGKLFLVRRVGGFVNDTSGPRRACWEKFYKGGRLRGLKFGFWDLGYHLLVC